MVVAAALGRAVAGKVLHTRHNVGVRREIALIATHQRFGNARAQERVFAGTFSHTTPAGIVADVDHRAIGPAHAVAAGFARRNACRLFNGWDVPRAGQCQRNRKGGLVAVNHIEAENQWNFQAALLYGNLLCNAHLLGAGEAEHTAHLAFGYLFGYIGVGLGAGENAGNGEV